MMLFPLSQTACDWKTYIHQMKDILGRSVTTSLDARWVNITQSPSDFLATLREIETPGKDPFDLVGSLLDHFHLTMGMVATRSVTTSVTMKSRLDFTTVETKQPDFMLTLLSGTLSQWRSAVLNCCVSDMPYDVRHFGTSMLDYFDRTGLKQFLVGITKVSLGDGTVRLSEKRG